MRREGGKGRSKSFSSPFAHNEGQANVLPVMKPASPAVVYRGIAWAASASSGRARLLT